MEFRALGTDKSLARGMTFNRSQRDSCSATYETLSQNQVVYEYFSTTFPTNMLCVNRREAAPIRPHSSPESRGTPHRPESAIPGQPVIRGARVSSRLGGILT